MRHEKIFIVLLAYIIGFTTAFIAYGLNYTIVDDNVYAQINTTPIADVQNTDPIVQVNNTQSASALTATLTEEGLFAVLNGKQRVISANVKDSASNEHGFHVAIATVEVSPDNRFIYFCEQRSLNANECHSYIYALETDSVHIVQTTADEDVVASTEKKVVWLTDSRLIVDGYVSESNETPWNVMVME